jgi:hypothetical protein
MKRMSKWKISLYLTALFLAGVVTGGFLTVKLGSRMMSQERMVGRMRGELESKLQLTPEQVQQITPILHEAMKDFRARFADEILVAMSNCNTRIEGVLTPEQKVKFAGIVREQTEFVRAGFKKAQRPSDP